MDDDAPGFLLSSDEDTVGIPWSLWSHADKDCELRAAPEYHGDQYGDLAPQMPLGFVLPDIGRAYTIEEYRQAKADYLANARKR